MPNPLQERRQERNLICVFLVNVLPIAGRQNYYYFVGIIHIKITIVSSQVSFVCVSVKGV
jgi:hypothetical protein